MDHDARKFSIFIPYTVIGLGALADLGAIVQQLKVRKVLVVTDGGLVRTGFIDRLRMYLDKDGISYDVFDGCLPDAPFSVIRRCAQVAREQGHEAMVGVGGGSVLDTVKAASILATGTDDLDRYLGQYRVDHPGLPTILIPTTAGTAAEWTWAAVITDDSKGLKRSIYSHFLHPKAVIIDPLLTVPLPPRSTAETGMDALIHGIEAYVSCKSNLVSDMFAEQTIRLVSANLRRAYERGHEDVEARYEMAVAAALGFCFIFSGLGLAHAMAYPLQMRSGVSHGVSCSMLIPHVMTFNMAAAEQKYAKIAELMGGDTEGMSVREKALRSVEAVRQLSIDVGMPQRMRDVGVKQEDIPGFVDNVLTYQPHVVGANPREAGREAIEAIFHAAW